MARQFVVKASTSARQYVDRLWSMIEDDTRFADAALDELVSRLSDDEARDVLETLGVPTYSDDEDYEEYE